MDRKTDDGVHVVEAQDTYYLVDRITEEVDDCDFFTEKQAREFNSSFEEKGQPYEWINANAGTFK